MGSGWISRRGDIAPNKGEIKDGCTGSRLWKSLRVQGKSLNTRSHGWFLSRAGPERKWSLTKKASPSLLVWWRQGVMEAAQPALSGSGSSSGNGEDRGLFKDR